MATTSIWSIKNNLKQSINYIINPEKTINKDYGKNSYSYLEIENTENNYKNEKVCYVSSINCSERNPYEDMLFTKEEYGKTNGILAFHGYQSFKEREVSADIAHEIGVKFAEEMFKDYDISILSDKSMTKEELISVLEQFYTKEKQEKYGVLGIRIELI